MQQHCVVSPVKSFHLFVSDHSPGVFIRPPADMKVCQHIETVWLGGAWKAEGVAPLVYNVTCWEGAVNNKDYNATAYTCSVYTEDGP